MCVVDCMMGVTKLHDVVYIFCELPSAITMFDATTGQRLKDIDVKDFRDPCDIVACERTSGAYVADNEECIWRVSADGADIQHWLPKSPDDTFKPSALSVTSTRLLVTSQSTRQLRQFDADGNELRRVQLLRHMEPQHAVESPTGTFIVSLYSIEMMQCQVVEVNTGGEVLRQFSGSLLTPLTHIPHVAVDSHGNIFVADYDNRRIVLLDNHLFLRRVIIDEHQLNYDKPRRLCFSELSGQLWVGLSSTVAVFDVLCR